MPAEQQPEEAATKLPAAVASAAGSFTQTRMYGRGFRHRGGSTDKEPDDKQKATEQDPAQQATRADSPDQPAQPAPAPAGDDVDPAPGRSPVQWGEVGQLTASLDDPAAQAALLSGTPAGGSGVDQDPAAQVGEPDVSAEMLATCSAQDAAAAQARLVQGQQLELPPVAPPAPGMAPGL
jgi:cytoskeletal protein RodZ